MGRVFKWLLVALLVLLLLLGGAALALHRWVNGDDFRARAEREASAALGVPVQLGGLSVEVWPLPGVGVQGVRVQTRPALTVGEVSVRPAWAALAAGEVAVASLVVRDAVLPAQAIAALGAAGRKPPAGAPKKDAPAAAVPWPRRAVLERITWVDEKGQRLTFDAQARLGDDGVPESATFKVLQGRFAGAQGRLSREGRALPVQVDIGGGRIAGTLQVQPGRGGAQLLTGQLATEGVEVAALTAPSRPLTGRLQAQTTLRAEFRDIGGLADALTTQTRFTVQGAVLQGLDLANAVTTLGLSRGGLTRLDTLTGHVSTQGRAVQLTQLVASSSVLRATGNVAMAPNRSLNGRIDVDLATTKGQVAVPLVVSGTADSPSVMLTREAMLGAAIGTAVAPGAGTAAGATLGDRVGTKLRGLFGN